MHTHKLEMDTFRKDIATQRLDLSKRSLALREEQHKYRLSQKALSTCDPQPSTNSQPSTSPESDQPASSPDSPNIIKLGDHTIDLDALEIRAFKHFNVPEDQWEARRARSRKAREKRLQAERNRPNAEKTEKEKSAETKTRSADGAELTPMIPATQNSGRDEFHVVPDISPNIPPIQSTQQNSGITPNICNSAELKTPTAPPPSSIAHCPSPISVGSTQNSEDSLKTQNSPMHSHTIRRCRSYIHGLPAELRDDSWINECPCGATLPCRQHIDLARELRYVNPINNDYAAALARHGLPFHVPTPEELNPAAKQLRLHSLTTNH